METEVVLGRLATCYLPLTAFRPGMALLTFNNPPALAYDDAKRAEMFVDALVNAGSGTPREEGEHLIQRLWKGVSPAEALSAWKLSTCKGATPWWQPDHSERYTPNIMNINDDFRSNLAGLFLWQVVMHRVLPGYSSGAVYLKTRLNKEWPKESDGTRFFSWCGGHALLKAWDKTGMNLYTGPCSMALWWEIDPLIAYPSFANWQYLAL